MNKPEIIDEVPTAETLQKVYERANAPEIIGVDVARGEDETVTTLYTDLNAVAEDLRTKAPKPTKAELQAAVQAQLRKTGLNRHGRRALLAQVKRKARK